MVETTKYRNVTEVFPELNALINEDQQCDITTLRTFEADLTQKDTTKESLKEIVEHVNHGDKMVQYHDDHFNLTHSIKPHSLVMLEPHLSNEQYYDWKFANPTRMNYVHPKTFIHVDYDSHVLIYAMETYDEIMQQYTKLQQQSNSDDVMIKIHTNEGWLQYLNFSHISSIDSINK